MEVMHQGVKYTIICHADLQCCSAQRVVPPAGVPVRGSNIQFLDHCVLVGPIDELIPGWRGLAAAGVDAALHGRRVPLLIPAASHVKRVHPLRLRQRVVRKLVDWKWIGFIMFSYLIVSGSVSAVVYGNSLESRFSEARGHS